MHADQRIHRRMAQEHIQHRLFQRGAIIVRAVAPLAVYHQPAFFAAVFPLAQHIAEITQRFIDKKAMQINLARKRQAPGGKRVEASFRNVRQINGKCLADVRRLPDTLRFDAAAL